MSQGIDVNVSGNERQETLIRGARYPASSPSVVRIRRVCLSVREPHLTIPALLDAVVSRAINSRI